MKIKLYHSISYLRINPFITFICVCIWASILTSAWGAPPTRNIVFAEAGSHKLKLNLYLPKDELKPPLVIFIHGGGWMSGSYKNSSTAWLTDYGFAVASISYRLNNKAVSPAQIHDCKVAVCWLRSHAID
ncbi:MAG: acetyl esterase/lipase [Cryomorphaceae bacterium]|jgi:acetyl esterase/lipase